MQTDLYTELHEPRRWTKQLCETKSVHEPVSSLPFQGGCPLLSTLSLTAVEVELATNDVELLFRAG